MNHASGIKLLVELVPTDPKYFPCPLPHLQEWTSPLILFAADYQGHSSQLCRSLPPAGH